MYVSLFTITHPQKDYYVYEHCSNRPVMPLCERASLLV
ncbi:hypothetical protein CHCC20335_1770 [Bacillus paralicheniformis]|nr:hypothetical protein CHCC20335_1770 [Bacillus paralicheniformis]